MQILLTFHLFKYVSFNEMLTKYFNIHRRYMLIFVYAFLKMSIHTHIFIIETLVFVGVRNCQHCVSGTVKCRVDHISFLDDVVSFFSIFVLYITNFKIKLLKV